MCIYVYNIYTYITANLFLFFLKNIHFGMFIILSRNYRILRGLLFQFYKQNVPVNKNSIQQERCLHDVLKDLLNDWPYILVCSLIFIFQIQ